MGKDKAKLKRGRGRPSLGPEPLDEVIRVRVSARDAREVEVVAQEHGVSVSSWVRGAILRLLR